VITRSEMIIVPSMVFAWVTDFDVGRGGGGYFGAILVYTIGCCGVIGAMSQDMSYVEGNPSARC
jgi:hypothetical protein